MRPETSAYLWLALSLTSSAGGGLVVVTTKVYEKKNT